MKSLIPGYHRLFKKMRDNKNAASQPRSSDHGHILLFIKEEGDIIEPHSSAKPDGGAIINPAIIEYLETRVHNIRHNSKVTIEIEYGGKIPDDPLLPEKLIKKELKTTILVSSKQNRSILIGSLLLALAGIGILAFIGKFPSLNHLYAFNELFVVVSWVFIWRFVEMFFFDRTKLRFRRMKLLQIFSAEYRIKEPDTAAQ
ncbi:MAG: hypothetical protein FWF29_07800 [Treponema sp.]|nr:hypothetical protein [Treponema sp.]